MSKKLYMNMKTGDVSTTAPPPSPPKQEAPVQIINKVEGSEEICQKLEELKMAIYEQQHNPIASPKPIDMTPMAEAIEVLAKQQTEVITALNRLVSVVEKPKRIVRDKNGKPLGIE